MRKVKGAFVFCIFKISISDHLPNAGGEQEPSMRNFRWLIGNNALDIVQPDIFCFGGMMRSCDIAVPRVLIILTTLAYCQQYFD